jgi:hypothetical protein
MLQVKADAARTQAQQMLPILCQSAILERICWLREEELGGDTSSLSWSSAVVTGGKTVSKKLGMYANFVQSRCNARAILLFNISSTTENHCSHASHI